MTAVAGRNVFGRGSLKKYIFPFGAATKKPRISKFADVIKQILNGLHGFSTTRDCKVQNV